MDPLSSPGDDGPQAGVYQRFAGSFVPHMHQAHGEIEEGGLPDSWVVALVRSLAKEPGSAAVEARCPTALQQARLKWLAGILLLQLQDALFQIAPPCQKAYLKVRTMYDHLASVQQRWDSGPGDSWACWVAIDYSKAYDCDSYPMLCALFRYIHIPKPRVQVPCQVLRGAVHFLVGGDVERSQVLNPASGIRQGDPLSPILLSLVTSLIVYVLAPLANCVAVF